MVAPCEIRIEITDHGEGIPKEDLPHIFDRYYKVDKVHKRAVTGTGLGLSIVKGILEKHALYATGTTGKVVMENTGLNVYRFLSGPQGGDQQIGARIAYNEIDLVLFFRDPLNADNYEPDVFSLLRLCDMHNIPIATNAATAEVLIHGLERGDLDWRDIVNPKD